MELYCTGTDSFMPHRSGMEDNLWFAKELLTQSWKSHTWRLNSLVPILLHSWQLKGLWWKMWMKYSPGKKTRHKSWLSLLLLSLYLSFSPAVFFTALTFHSTHQICDTWCFYTIYYLYVCTACVWGGLTNSRTYISLCSILFTLMLKIIMQLLQQKPIFQNMNVYKQFLNKTQLLNANGLFLFLHTVKITLKICMPIHCFSHHFSLVSTQNFSIALPYVYTANRQKITQYYPPCPLNLLLCSSTIFRCQREKKRISIIGFGNPLAWDSLNICCSLLPETTIFIARFSLRCCGVQIHGGTWHYPG